MPVLIVRDDEFTRPLYADLAVEDLDYDAWEAACEAVDNALEGQGGARGVRSVGRHRIGWLTRTGVGLSFVAVVEDEVTSADVRTYLADLARTYMDEVDDPRNPGSFGVDDVLSEVIPPWEL